MPKHPYPPKGQPFNRNPRRESKGISDPDAGLAEALRATQGSAPRYIGILWVEDLGTGRIQLRDLIIDSIL